VAGALLGETEMIRPDAAMGAPAPVRAALKPTSGVHNLYFVFTNPAAGPQQSLFIVLTATFENAPAPPATRAGTR
jgi:hypothetical protein